jgi:hypothetical protein
VRVAQVVDPDREVHAAGLDGGEPDPGAEGVARDRRAGGGCEQQLVVTDAVGLDVLGDGVEPGLADGEDPGFVVLGVGLGQVALAGGGVLLGDLDDGLLHDERPPEFFKSSETSAG